MTCDDKADAGGWGADRPPGPMTPTGFGPDGWPVLGPVAWGDFRAELLALYEPPLRSRATQQQMGHILDVAAALGAATTADLTPAFVARFLASRPATESPNTTHGLLARLRVACNYAAARGYCRMSPFALRKRWVRRVAVREKRHHSRDEIARVLAAMEQDIGRKRGWGKWRARRLHALVSTFAYTGLRRNEGLYLRVEDVDLDDRMLFVRARSGNRLKTEASAAPVPIPEALAAILAAWLPHLELPDAPAEPGYQGFRPGANPDAVRDAGWLFPNATRTGPWLGGSAGNKPIDRMKAMARKAGVEGFTFLSLRHSWATHAEFWGLSDAMIQRVLRHTNVRTQHHYRHADADNLRRTIRGVDFGYGPGVDGDGAP